MVVLLQRVCRKEGGPPGGLDLRAWPNPWEARAHAGEELETRALVRTDAMMTLGSPVALVEEVASLSTGPTCASP